VHQLLHFCPFDCRATAAFSASSFPLNAELESPQCSITGPHMFIKRRANIAFCSYIRQHDCLCGAFRGIYVLFVDFCVQVNLKFKFFLRVKFNHFFTATLNFQINSEQLRHNMLKILLN